MDFTVVIPTHNPDLSRLRATLDGLRGQTLAAARWATVLVNNASSHFPDAAQIRDICPANLRVLDEPNLGLSSARRCGLRAARTPFVILVDDDNVLAPDYLANVVAIFSAHPRLGLAGGKSVPEFACEPPAWAREFFPLLALRDLGEHDLIAPGFREDAPSPVQYPACAPIGAGLAIRVAALEKWLARPAELSDRRGADLSSAGDNDMVLCAMRAGWDVGYFPALQLTHLIPPTRTSPTYLERLNRGIQRSWMQVLTLHQANSWPPIPEWSVPLRCLRMWFKHGAWRGPAERIRWQGACGHFEGRVHPTN